MPILHVSFDSAKCYWFGVRLYRKLKGEKMESLKKCCSSATTTTFHSCRMKCPFHFLKNQDMLLNRKLVSRKDFFTAIVINPRRSCNCFYVITRSLKEGFKWELLTEVYKVFTLLDPSIVYLCLFWDQDTLNLLKYIYVSLGSLVSKQTASFWRTLRSRLLKFFLIIWY